MSLSEIISDILSRGLDDWIDLAEVATVVKNFGPKISNNEVRDMSVAVVRELLQSGLMQVGDLARDGFHPWQLALGESVARIEDEWVALGRRPAVGEICWLHNTEAGNAKARSSIAQS